LLVFPANRPMAQSVIAGLEERALLCISWVLSKPFRIVQCPTAEVSEATKLWVAGRALGKLSKLEKPEGTIL